MHTFLLFMLLLFYHRVYKICLFVAFVHSLPPCAPYKNITEIESHFFLRITSPRRFFPALMAARLPRNKSSRSIVRPAALPHFPL